MALKQLKVLKDSKFIDNKLYYYLKPTDSPALRFYGQPKIHKPGVPIRPIVSYSGSPLYNLNKYIANNLKTDVKDENNNAKNSTTFSNYVRNVPIEDDEIMVSFDVTSLYTNIPIIDTLNIIKDYVHSDGQFTRKTAIPQEKFLDLVNLVLTTLGTLLIFSFTNKLIALQWKAQHLQPQEKFICKLMKVLQYLRHYTTQKFGNDLLMTFILFLNVRTWKTFSITSAILINSNQNIKFTMEEESNGELAFLDTLLKRNNGEISVLVYRRPTHTDQYLHYSSHHQTSCKESVVSSLFNRAYSIIRNKDANEIATRTLE